MASVNTYRCFVRPAGQLTHEVPKERVTATEIVLLRHIHGADAVVRITVDGAIKEYDREQDLRRLAQLYDPNRVGRVFNILPEFLTEELDDDEKPQLISLEVIESEAAGEEVNMRDVVRSAGPAAAAPQQVDTGPLYAGDSESKQAAEAVSRSLE